MDDFHGMKLLNSVQESDPDFPRFHLREFPFVLFDIMIKIAAAGQILCDYIIA